MVTAEDKNWIDEVLNTIYMHSIYVSRDELRNVIEKYLMQADEKGLRDIFVRKLKSRIPENSDLIDEVLGELELKKQVKKIKKELHDSSTPERLSDDELRKLYSVFKREFEHVALEAEKLHKSKRDSLKLIADVLVKYLKKVPVGQRREFIEMVISVSPAVEVAIDKYKLLNLC